MTAMGQHPKITVVWAIHGLETAVGHLGDGALERRVRDQFHQLVLALERDGYGFHLPRLVLGEPADVLDEDTSRTSASA